MVGLGRGVRELRREEAMRKPCLAHRLPKKELQMLSPPISEYPVCQTGDE